MRKSISKSKQTLDLKALYASSASPGKGCVMGAFPLVNRVTCIN